MLATGAAAKADPVEITERGNHVTEATVVVDATPAQIYELLTEYADWPRTLSDVRSVTIEAGERRDARVRFSSRAFEREVTFVFDNTADREIRFRAVDGSPGGSASGEYQLDPVDDRHTRVRARLYVVVGGAPGLFVSESAMRRLRQAKLHADLTDLARSFAPQVAIRP